MNYRIHFILPFFALLLSFHAASQSKDGKDSLTTTTNICACVEKKIDLIKSMFALVDRVKTLPEKNEVVCSEEYKGLGHSLILLEKECPRIMKLPEENDCESQEAWAQFNMDFELLCRVLEHTKEQLNCGSVNGDD